MNYFKLFFVVIVCAVSALCLVTFFMMKWEEWRLRRLQGPKLKSTFLGVDHNAEHRIIADDVSVPPTEEQRKAALEWYTRTFPGAAPPAGFISKGTFHAVDEPDVNSDLMTRTKLSRIKAPYLRDLPVPPPPWAGRAQSSSYALSDRHYEDAAPVAPQKHPSIQTRYGSLFDLITPTVGMVDIDDIALTCAREGRFGNRTRWHYSVAQHQVLAAILVWRRTRKAEPALRAGLHDAHEAYIGDIMTPVLWALEWDAGSGVVGAMHRLKDRVDDVILERFNLKPLSPLHAYNDFVKDADRQLLLWERDRFMEKPGDLWDIDEEKIRRLTAEDFGLTDDAKLLTALSAEEAYPLYWYMVRRLTQGWGLTGGLAENADLSELPRLHPTLAVEMQKAFGSS